MVHTAAVAAAAPIRSATRHDSNDALVAASILVCMSHAFGDALPKLTLLRVCRYQCSSATAVFAQCCRPEEYGAGSVLLPQAELRATACFDVPGKT